MKILIEQKKLAAMLSIAARAAAHSGSVIPVLTGVHMIAEKGRLTLTTYNFEVSVITWTDEVEIMEEGEVLSNAQYLTDFIGKLGNAPISLSLNKNASKLSVKYGRSKGEINTIAKNGWEPPKPDEQGYEVKFTAKSIQLKKALNNVLFACASEHFQKVFMGVLFEYGPQEGSRDGVVNMVASDTYKLAWYALSDVEDTKVGQFIAPAKYLKEVLRILKDTDDTVTVSSNNNSAVFKTDDTIISVRLLEGKYPNYRTIIPNTQFAVSMGSDILKSSLERIHSLPQNDKFKIPYAQFFLNSNREMKVEYISDAAGEISEIIPLEKPADLTEETVLMFNPQYLQEIVKNIGAKTQIGFSEPLKPALITGEESALKYVLVPMRPKN